MTAALEGGEWSAARPGRTLPPGKTRGPQGRSGRTENLVVTGIRSRTVQPVVSRCTDWATRSTTELIVYQNLEAMYILADGLKKRARRFKLISCLKKKIRPNLLVFSFLFFWTQLYAVSVVALNYELCTTYQSAEMGRGYFKPWERTTDTLFPTLHTRKQTILENIYCPVLDIFSIFLKLNDQIKMREFRHF